MPGVFFFFWVLFMNLVEGSGNPWLINGLLYKFGRSACKCVVYLMILSLWMLYLDYIGMVNKKFSWQVITRTGWCWLHLDQCQSKLTFFISFYQDVPDHKSPTGEAVPGVALLRMGRQNYFLWGGALGHWTVLGLLCLNIWAGLLGLS